MLPDLNEIEENSLWFGKKLKLGKKIQERTHKIFAFGVYHKAITVTANKGAVEAVKMQVNYSYLYNNPKLSYNIFYRIGFLRSHDNP